MGKQTEKLPLLEEGLLQAMSALDSQISKEVQRRTPAELEQHGVQKWEPYGTRIERVASFVLNAFADEAIGLDGILVLAQAYTKSLQLVVGDLGEEGLGKLRTGYTLESLQQISSDAERGIQLLKSEEQSLM